MGRVFGGRGEMAWGMPVQDSDCLVRVICCCETFVGGLEAGSEMDLSVGVRVCGSGVRMWDFVMLKV
jgi:hypothetical protein